MKVTLTSFSGGIFPLDISADLVVRDLLALAELETEIPQAELLLVHNMAPMVEPMKTVQEYGVEDGDVITVSRVEGGVSEAAGLSQAPQTSAAMDRATASGTSVSINWRNIAIPTSQSNEQGRPRTSGPGRNQGQQDPKDPETVRQHFLNDPYELSRLKQRNPPLAEALLSGDRERFRDALERQRRAVRDSERERIRMLNADPLDPSYQAKIAQDIRQKNIEENMEAALEHAPESFSRVVMLYLDIKVNGVLVKALVDSGARSTVMSQACAERCNIMRLVDRRFAGMAFGVGQQRILGRVHLGQLQIGRDFLISSFTVLESAPEDMLLGLDMLKRHQCCIDLKENCLRIGSTGSFAPFLTEKDLKEKQQVDQKQEEAFSEKEDFEMAQAVAASERLTRIREEMGTTTAEGSMLATSSQLTPHTSTSSHPHQSPQSHTSQTLFPEESIRQITSHGFSHSEAIQELRRTNGNVQQAIVALLARSIKL